MCKTIQDGRQFDSSGEMICIVEGKNKICLKRSLGKSKLIHGARVVAQQ